ncbi:hypothetical protein PISMIDRAFT_273854 [Pisolithus microcarpus 441]|uniref:Uncharacterized protein n=1 Tax=Pisolithus microcarpus 441 TaxID=765257 RepID=A0A0D0A2R3_9AGAM|nr:hypothetical protein BKA83DRAFT_273854 [Pisolithus microcarpus]KIK26358.1 hypothetical protein PISMIDRAFT_273854 [Pisolithus microcarpus 441]
MPEARKISPNENVLGSHRSESLGTLAIGHSLCASAVKNVHTRWSRSTLGNCFRFPSPSSLKAIATPKFRTLDTSTLGFFPLLLPMPCALQLFQWFLLGVFL